MTDTNNAEEEKLNTEEKVILMQSERRMMTEGKTSRSSEMVGILNLELNYTATFASRKFIELCICAQGLCGDGIVLSLHYGGGYTNLYRYNKIAYIFIHTYK